VGADSFAVQSRIGAEAPAITLELESRPETLTLVRGMLGGIAELVAMDAELLDDLKTAISEACNNVVLHAYSGGTGPLTVQLTLGPDRIEALVRDAGCGIPELASSDERIHGVGIPVIRALTERAEFRHRAEGGTEVLMAFGVERDGKRLFSRPADAAPDDGWAENLAGDAVVSVSPVSLLAGVLGRLSRAMAASARFSLDRFSDVYLVTDAIAAQASSDARSPRIGFAISVKARRLELSVGPLRPGSLEAWQAGDEPQTSPRALLEHLTDELTAETVGEAEMLRVVMLDHTRSSI
jgi:anti-sigma regulatory factor (Ser/Thr protein kinase)